MKYVELSDYEFHAAGRVWRVPSLKLTVMPDGTRGISQVEIDRVHTAIANEICGASGPMTFDELEFLCEVTSSPFTEVADLLGLHKSTLSRWRQTGSVPKRVYGYFLRKHFWFRLFGEQLGTRRIDLGTVANEEEFLRFAHDEAIRKHLADPVALAA